MWNGRRIGVVLPTYNEKSSIRACIEAFDGLGVVDEIVVVNNNAIDGTSDEVRRTCAREVFESTQGYGAAIRRGLQTATTDLICICEPDGTFEPRDLVKLLVYAEECDAVFGTRTVSDFIWHGANMGWFLRWGNWAVAKLVEVLFNTNCLSDVGCTMRIISRPALQQIEPLFRVTGSHFGVEMLLLSLLSGHRVVQIPINYRRRAGAAGITGDRRRAFAVGVRMILKVVEFRLRSRQLRRLLARSRESAALLADERDGCERSGVREVTSVKESG